MAPAPQPARRGAPRGALPGGRCAFLMNPAAIQCGSRRPPPRLAARAHPRQATIPSPYQRCLHRCDEQTWLPLPHPAAHRPPLRPARALLPAQAITSMASAGVHSFAFLLITLVVYLKVGSAVAALFAQESTGEPVPVPVRRVETSEPVPVPVRRVGVAASDDLCSPPFGGYGRDTLGFTAFTRCNDIPPSDVSAESLGGVSHGFLAGGLEH